MSCQTQKREIPECFEKVDHHDPLTLHDKDRGIIVMVHDLRSKSFANDSENQSREVQDRRTEQRAHIDEYPFRVTGTQNQKYYYEGVFDSKSHAMDKAKELAQQKAAE